VSHLYFTGFFGKRKNEFHLAFLSEFTLNTVLVKTIGSMGFTLEGTDYLNWSGQQLYKELKAKAQNQPDQ